jgi:hypothetical protein
MFVVGVASLQPVDYTVTIANANFIFHRISKRCSLKEKREGESANLLGHLAYVNQYR